MSQFAEHLANVSAHVEATTCPGCGTAAAPAIVMRCLDCGRIWADPRHDTAQSPPDFAAKTEDA